MPSVFDAKKFFGLNENKKVENWLIKQIEQRFANQRNLLMCITGETGSGKSYAALRIGQCISRHFGTPFTVDQVLFNPLEFFRLVKTLPSRSVIIFDEGSLTLDAQRWALTESKLLGYVAETYRFKQYVTIICAPDLAMINSRVRRCAHALIRMYGNKGEEGRVYRLVPTQLGAQYLRGVGVLRNIVPPDYEFCQRPSCRKCEKYRTCDLLRAQYERKKEEAFSELLDYIEYRISQFTLENVLSSSPYGFREKMRRALQQREQEEYGSDVAIDEESEMLGGLM